jgi:hypothetical protein
MLGHKKTVDVDKLRAEGGIEAAATVISSKLESRSKTSHGVTHLMHVSLYVQPDGQAAFRTSVKQSFGDPFPLEGDRLRVVYDGHNHERIAILAESIDRPAGGANATGMDFIQALHAAQQTGDTEAIHQLFADHRAAGGGAHVFVNGVEVDPSQVGAQISVDGSQMGAQIAARATPQVDVATQLGKLAELRDRGVLTEAEFDAQKSKLLGS